MAQISKKLTCIAILLNLTLILFSGVLDEFIYILDIDQLIVSNDPALNVLGMYLKYYEDGNVQYKTVADQSRTYINLNLEPDDSLILDILSGYQKGNKKDTINKIESAQKKYPNSVVINAIKVIFLFDEYKNTKDFDLSKNILSSLDIIKRNKGENPFCNYYESLIKWDLANEYEKETIFSNLEKTYNSYSNNINILELLICQAFELSKYEKIAQLAPRYEKEPKKNEAISLVIAFSFNYLDEKDKARNIVESLIQNSDKKNILSKSYELLGDISDTYTQKKKNYEFSLTYDPKNVDSLAKLGILLYQNDTKNSLELSRIYLTKAIILDPNNEQVANVLMKINNKLEKRLFLISFIPLFLILVVIVYLLYKFSEEETEVKDERQ
jgi:tetratricopeptide (TPR) repeat protein